MGKNNFVLGVEGEVLEIPLEERIKLGIVGCGAHTFRNILPCLQYLPGLELVATCDLNKEKARLYAKQFGANNYFTEIKEMVDNVELNGILCVVGFDPDTGYPRYPAVVPQILEKGIPVWMEKPPAYCAAEVLRMDDSAQKGSVFAQVGFKMMFAPGVEKVKEIITTPVFGKPQSFVANYAVDMPDDIRNLKDPGSRRFLDDVVHILSQLHYFFGKPEYLTHYKSGSSGGFAVLEYESGLTGALHLKGGARLIGPDESIDIVGEGGIVKIDGGTKITYHERGDPGSYGRDISFLRRDGTHTHIFSPELRQPLGALSLHSHALYGYILELAHFVNCIRNKKGETANLNDAHNIMQVYDSFAANPRLRTAIGSSEIRKTTLTSSPRFDYHVSCTKCGVRMSCKDGWSLVCAPPSGCGCTRNICDYDSGDHFDKNTLTDAFFNICNKNKVSIENPIIQISHSGVLRSEMSRVYVVLTPNSIDGKKYFAKLPQRKNDIGPVTELSVLKSNQFSPLLTPRPIDVIGTNGIVFDYIEGSSLDKLIRSSDCYDSNTQILCSKAIIGLGKFHDKVLLREKEGLHFGGTHNDFDPFNMLYTRKDELYVIDWEDYQSDGIQESDLIHFIIMSGIIQFDGQSRSEQKNSIFRDKAFASFADSLINEYFSARSFVINKDCLRGAIKLYSENQITRLQKSGRNSELFIYPHLLKDDTGIPKWLI